MTTSGAPSSIVAAVLRALAPLVGRLAAAAASGSAQAAPPTTIRRRSGEDGAVRTGTGEGRRPDAGRDARLSSGAGAQPPRLLRELARQHAVGPRARGAAVALQLERIEQRGERLAGAAEALAHARARARAAPRAAPRRRRARAARASCARAGAPRGRRDGGRTRPRPRRRAPAPLSAPTRSSARSSQPATTKPMLLQHVELLAARVVEHPLVPAVVDRLPAAAQAARTAAGSSRRACRRRSPAAARAGCCGRCGRARPRRSGRRGPSRRRVCQYSAQACAELWRTT